MITPLPSLDRTSPTFKTQVDTFFATQLPQFSVEVEAARVEVNAGQVSANTSKLSATASAAAALASELAAASYANAGRWVSGANYALGAVVWSPTTSLLYRCTLAIAGGTVDPSADTSHWSAPLVAGVSAGGTGATTAADARANLGAAVLTSRTNWGSQPGGPDQVAGLLGWRNFGNGHVIYDASKGLSPDGLTAVSNTNPSSAWAATFPTLMGWNGTGTYGVRVDRARVAEELIPTSNYTVNNRLSFSYGGGGFLSTGDATYGNFYKPVLDGSQSTHVFTNAAGGGLMFIDNAGKVSATTMQATTFIGTLSGSITGNAATANSASGASFLTAVGSSSAAFTVRLSGYADVSIFSDATQWGLYSAAGGLMCSYNRGAGTFSFAGNAATASYAASAGSASSATSAGYAGNAGTVNSLTTAQVATAYSAVGIYDMGSTIFAMNVGGSVTVGQAVDGSALRFADDNGDTNSTVFGGTWICRGHAPSGHSTLWQRIA